MGAGIPLEIAVVPFCVFDKLFEHLVHTNRCESGNHAAEHNIWADVPVIDPYGHNDTNYSDKCWNVPVIDIIDPLFHDIAGAETYPNNDRHHKVI